MEELEKFLMKELKALLEKYEDLYLAPVVRDNGDFLIRLSTPLEKASI